MKLEERLPTITYCLKKSVNNEVLLPHENFDFIMKLENQLYL